MSKTIKSRRLELGIIGMSRSQSCLKAFPNKFEVVAAYGLIPEEYEK